MKKHWLLLGLALPAVLPVRAQSVADYPNRAISIVYPYAVGSVPEAILREITEALSLRLGQPVVIDAKPGGSAVIGGSYVARAKPDGYTLLFGDSGGTYALNSLKRNAQYNALKDFDFIARIASSATFLLVRPDSPYTSVRDLINDAKQDGKRLRYGSNGVGSAFHLAVERFALLTNTPNLSHIPYKGSPETNRALMNGEIDFALNGGLGNVKAGRGKPLAVATTESLAVLPDVPTFAEATGLKDYNEEEWWTLSAPAGTPPAIIAKLNQAVAEITAKPAFRAKYAALGFQVRSDSPQDAADFIRQTTKKWQGLLDELQLQL